MSIIRNAAAEIVPIREQRSASGVLAANNAELVIPLNGDDTALVYIQSTNFIGTLEFTGVSNADETQFFPVVAYPYSPGCAGGTIPLAGQPLLLDTLNASQTARVYSVPVGQLKALRVRVSAFTSGSCVCTITADQESPLNTAIASKPSTLLITATGAAGAAVTATLPAVAGLRHVVDFIDVVRSATVVLTASATPLLVTTTNLPGNPALTCGQDAAQIGQDKLLPLNFGSTGLAATALGTATTVVCPAAAGSIWRINVGYRLGL